MQMPLHDSVPYAICCTAGAYPEHCLFFQGEIRPTGPEGPYRVGLRFVQKDEDRAGRGQGQRGKHAPADRLCASPLLLSSRAMRRITMELFFHFYI